MKYWIVWRSKCKYSDGLNYILGVYTDEASALKACNKQNKSVRKNYENMTKKDIIVVHDNMLDAPNNNDDEWLCSRVSFTAKMTRLYFIVIIELGGAESYGNGQQWIHVCLNKKSAIGFAVDFFDNEHNREGECEDCIDNDKCKKGLVKCLKKDNVAEIECTDNHPCPYASCEIFRVVI